MNPKRRKMAPTLGGGSGVAVALRRAGGEPVEGAADGGDQHPRLVGAVGVLVVLGQPAVATQTGDALLHDPARPLHHERGGPGRSTTSSSQPSSSRTRTQRSPRP